MAIKAGVAWSLAISILLVVCGPLLMGIGIARGWNVATTAAATATATRGGSYAFYAVEDPSRFWPEPNEYNETAKLDAIYPSRNYPSASSTWYYWKLRPSDSDDHCDDVTNPPELHTMSCVVHRATTTTRAIAWTCYVVHQCAIWGLIYKAQRERADDVHYDGNLRWYNVWSFIVNLVAYLVHLLQTHVTYDATAQDVTESSSQGSVIMLLVMILLMEYKHRGLFLGWPAMPDDVTGKCSWRLPTRPIELVRKYHGYAFSWATIYTLWYHPMEPTVGHVMGFLHTGALLIQQSLIFTPIHVNRYWKLVLETWVAIHGAVVAIQMRQEGGWAMFLFGFLWIFAFTSIHGIPYYLGFVEVARAQRIGNDASTETFAMVPKSRWVRYLVRLVPPVVYFAIVLAVYATVLSREDGSFNPLFIIEIIRIPSILYLLVLFTAFVGWGMISVANACSGGENGIPPQYTVKPSLEEGEETSEVPLTDNADESDGTQQQRRSQTKGFGTGTVMAGFAFCYMIMIAVSVIIEQMHVQLNLLLLMIACVIVFTIFSLVAMVLMDSQLHRTALGGPRLPSAVSTRQ
jgi:hypothetical protein